MMTSLSPKTRVVLALGTAQTLSWASTYYLAAILAVPMARDLGLSLPQVFGLFSAGLVVSALLGPAAGRLIDLHGGRGVLVASNFLAAGGLCILATAQGFLTLGCGWLILGVAMAFGLYDAAFATLAGLFGREARSPMTGITLIAGFASTVGWPISAVLDAEIGWRGACLVWAAAHILIGLPLNRFLVPKPSPPEEQAELVAHDVASANGAPRFAMPLLAFVFTATLFVTGALAAHLPNLMQSAGATPAAAVLAGMLIGPAQVAARILEFGLLRHFHPIVPARLAALAHPVGAVAVLALGAPAAMVFAVLHGAGNGLLTIVKGTLPLAFFGPVGYGVRQGLISAPGRLSQAVAPFLFGLMIDAYGIWALVLSAGLSLSAFAVLLALRPANPERAGLSRRTSS